MYKIQQDGFKRLADGAYIPAAEDNIDYQAVLQWIADGNSPEPQYTLDERRVLQIAKIKDDATSRILAILPEVKQRNSLARSLELTHKVVTGVSLTDQESAEVLAIQAKWDEIKAVRVLSNIREGEINLSDNPESIEL